MKHPSQKSNAWWINASLHCHYENQWRRASKNKCSLNKKIRPYLMYNLNSQSKNNHIFLAIWLLTLFDLGQYASTVVSRIKQ